MRNESENIRITFNYVYFLLFWNTLLNGFISFFQKGVFVLDVFPDGAAGKDGRLQPGDRIIDINKESFKAVEQEKAYQTVLRITQGPVSSNFTTVRII